MQNLAKIAVSTLEGEPMSEGSEPKRQLSIYLPKDLDRDILYEVLQRKERERTYSVTAFMEEASRLYLMVLRYQKEARSTQTPYEFTMGAMKTFLDLNKRK